MAGTPGAPAPSIGSLRFLCHPLLELILETITLTSPELLLSPWPLSALHLDICVQMRFVAAPLCPPIHLAFKSQLAQGTLRDFLILIGFEFPGMLQK